MMLELIRIKNSEDKRAKDKEFEKEIHEIGKKFNRAIIAFDSDGGLFITGKWNGAKQ